MNLIRKWIYDFGFRPSPKSIFYSPSRAYLLAAEEAMAAAAEFMRENSSMDSTAMDKVVKKIMRDMIYGD